MISPIAKSHLLIESRAADGLPSSDPVPASTAIPPPIVNLQALDFTKYQSPFSARYASPEMSRLFSLQNRHAAWRRVWIELAKCEKELGLPISQEQIDEMEMHVEDIDFAAADRYEKETNHDVMAHVHAFADQCPKAKPIIHLGATSCLVTDNADLMILRDALKLVQTKILTVIGNLAETALKYKDLPCLSYTHLQPAQPTTVGKRIALWLQGFEMAHKKLQDHLNDFRALGAKGATGTQASFLELFEGDEEKVKKLDESLAEKLGFSSTFPIAVQTYPRSLDTETLYCLSRIAQNAHKMTADLRLLAGFGEMGEPFGKKQVGSSAMPYKRNPIQFEQICSLSDHVMSLTRNAETIAANQWLERTLDDSANRRAYLPEAFLATAKILDSLSNIAKNMVIHQKAIGERLHEELPFLATETILMACAKKPQGDRQDLHEEIRKLCQEVRDGRLAKGELFQKLKERLPLSPEEFERAVDPRILVGRAPQQTEEYIVQIIQPLLRK